MIEARLTGHAKLHCYQTSWEVVKITEFDSNDDDNLNYYTNNERLVMIPVHCIQSWHHSHKRVARTIDPTTGQEQWQSMP